jgi:hypothetical protein
MNRPNWKTNIAVFCLLISFITPARAADDLSTRDWSVNDMRPLPSYAPSNVEVETLVNRLIDADWNMPLCSFKFIDVYDGQYRLIALLDVNGRHNCEKLVVVEKSGAHFNIVNNFQVLGVDNVNDLLQDVDNDRSPEIVVTQGWSRPENGSCRATWQKIYKWHDGRFIDESASFLNYYKERRVQLTAALLHDPDSLCHQMEIDKIDRLLGQPTAGFDRAAAMMKSADESMRRKAATIFADIGDGPSKKNLALLAKDSDPLTAKSAQLYIDEPEPKE